MLSRRQPRDCKTLLQASGLIQDALVFDAKGEPVHELKFPGVSTKSGKPAYIMPARLDHLLTSLTAVKDADRMPEKVYAFCNNAYFRRAATNAHQKAQANRLFHLACLDVEGGFHIFRLFLSLSPLFFFFSWLSRPLATPFTIASRSSGAASTSASPAPVQLGSAVTAVAEGTPDSAEPADVPDESDLPQPGAARPRRATGVFKAMMDAQQQRQEKDKGPTASDFPEVAVQFSPAVNLYLNKLLAELRKTEDLPSHFKRTGPLVFSQSERTAFNPPLTPLPSPFPFRSFACLCFSQPSRSIRPHS